MGLQCDKNCCSARTVPPPCALGALPEGEPWCFFFIHQAATSVPAAAGIYSAGALAMRSSSQLLFRASALLETVKKSTGGK